MDLDNHEEIETGSDAEVEPEGHAATEAQAEAYWCVICQRAIPLQDGIYIHDDKPGHEVLTFDEESRAQ
jgi:hypothetical protein